MQKQPAIWLPCGVLLALVAGCSRHLRQAQTPIAIPASFSTAGPAAPQQRWWRAFNDDQLNALIEQALADSFTLQIAWDRLAGAEALAKASGASLWPQVDLRAAAGRTRQETDAGVVYTSSHSLGVGATYEVDLWSSIRSSQEAALLDVQAGRDAVDTAAITLAASIADTWYRLGEAKALVRIAQQQIATNQQVLDVVTVQFRNNMASAADVLRQRQLVASTQARLISAEETVRLLQYRLSALIGIPPQLAWQQTQIDLPDLPPAPDPSVPAELLWRRPDVRQVYRRVQAADQRLAAAVADQYPRLSLSASAETSAMSARDLFDDWLANVAANIVQPLFDASLRKAQVQRQQAAVSEAIHTWGQTILDALGEVETALTQQRQQAKLLENLRLQLRLARDTYGRNRERFVKGQVDYIRVLESLQSLQGLERDVVTAQRTLVERRIDLHRSIAGSFDLTRPALARMNAPGHAGQDPPKTVQDK